MLSVRWKMRQQRQRCQQQQSPSAPPQPQRLPEAAGPGAGQPATPASPVQLESLLELFRCLQAKHQAVTEAVQGMEQEMDSFVAALKAAAAEPVADTASNEQCGGYIRSGCNADLDAM